MSEVYSYTAAAKSLEVLRLETQLMATCAVDASMAQLTREVYLLLAGTVTTVLGIAVTAYMAWYVNARPADALVWQYYSLGVPFENAPLSCILKQNATVSQA